MTLPEALQLAFDHYTAGRQGVAESIYRQLLAQIPNEVIALHGVGYLASKIGRVEEGIQLLSRAIAIDPQKPDPHFDLAEMLRATCRLDDAVAEMQTVIRLQPNRAEAYFSLGRIYYDLSRMAESVAECQRCLALSPKNPDVYHLMAAAYLLENRCNDAARAAEAALEIKPDHAGALANLGLAYMRQGRVVQACEINRRAMELRPDQLNMASNYLYSTLYLDVSAEMVAAEHVRWGKVFESHILPILTHPNSPEPDRRLRIGYVSGDFRAHAISFFIEPILANHDRNNFELTAYCNNYVIDSTSQRQQSYFHQWRQIHNLSDDQVASLIAEDQIDILIDLSVHSSGNRLGVFARKPAPVQMTYLGYPGTTGLSAVDYRITARDLDLADAGQGPEKLLPLPRTYFCYQPPEEAPEVVEAPALSNGFVTFGSFNRLSKLSDRAVAAWATILRSVPTAKLQLMALGTNELATCELVANRFAAHGIEPERMIFEPSSGRADYFAAHQRVDIALDTFPYNGGTTTLHALWMGVPVISLAERRVVSRLGLNILNAIGLGELLGESEAEYIAKACALAGDRAHLNELRSGMRDRLRASPVMNGPQFTRDLESLYRQAWRRWTKT